MDEMLEAEIWSVTHINQGKAVLLRPLGSDLVAPIYIGQFELHAILLGLGGVKGKRPLTCDVLLELIHRLGLVLFRVEVHNIRNDIFLARLLLGGREFSEANPLVIDSRPSDAIALAVREQCPVYLSSRVLDQAGIPVEIFLNAGEPPEFPGGPDYPEGDPAGPDGSGEEGPPETGPEGIPSLTVRRRRLQAELEEAVARESYERAAEIRDLLILLDQQLEQERRGRGDT